MQRTDGRIKATDKEQWAHRTCCGLSSLSSTIASLLGISLYAPAIATCTQARALAVLFPPLLGVCSFLGLPTPLPFLHLAKTPTLLLS